VNLFREVLFHFHSGSGLPGSGMIFSDSGSGSVKKFRILPDPQHCPIPQGVDPPPPKPATAGRNHLNEEITPLSPLR
jgi:hypothetical protein